MATTKQFITRHALIPGTLLIFSLWATDHFEVDYKLADLIWGLQGHVWTYRHSWLLQKVIHDDGKVLSRIMLICVLIAFCWSCLDKRGKRLRKALLYLMLVVPLSVSIINNLKTNSGTICPAELVRYGGDKQAPVRAFPFTINGQRGCTPAGHSSAGYTWLALYFFALAVAPRWRWHALFSGMCLGLVFGITQQIRGEHFISHDLWTIMICWFTPLCGYIIFFHNHNNSTNLRE